MALCDAITKGWCKASNKKELLENERGLHRRHDGKIRKVTPPQRLLDFNLSNGWGPLCEFLGKEISDVEFPRLNQKGGYQRKSKIMTDLMFQRILKRSKSA